MENASKRGIKRKRETRAELEDTASKLRSKLHHGLTEVKRASKKAKAFETQRIVKKLKAARIGGDERDIKNFEKQLECLKHIDLDDIAASSLRSKIKKDALLSKNEDCQEAVLSELPSSPSKSSSSSTVQMLVQNRMLSSKILSSEAVDVIQTLKLVLGIGRGDTVATDDGSEASDIEGDERTPQSLPKPAAVEKSGEVTENEGSEEESEEVASRTGFDEIDIGDESGQGNDSVEGSRSEGDDDEEQSLVSDNPSLYNSATSSSAKKAHSSVHTTLKQKIGKAGESTFLPTLSVGFISGSDSEWSESEVKVADLVVKKNRRGQRARKAIWEKKYGRNANHLKRLREVNDVRGDTTSSVRTGRVYGHGQRGQSGGRGSGAGIGRGRGSGVSGSGTGTRASNSQGRTNSVVRGRGHGHGHTNHIHNKPSTNSIQAHDHKHNLNPIRVNTHSHSKHTHTNNNNDRQTQGGSNVNGKSTSNVRPSHRRGGGDGMGGSKPLHPSWEAKRRMKERESQKLAIVPSTGTRIKFT